MLQASSEGRRDDFRHGPGSVYAPSHSEERDRMAPMSVW